MALKILDSVNHLLDRVKLETGKEVLLYENNKTSLLPQMKTFYENNKMSSFVEGKTAGQNDKNHLIAYSSNYTPEINYLIASKAIQFIRVYKESIKNRKTAVAYQEHMNNAKMSIALEVDRKPHLQVALNDQTLTSTWILSLINQLISQPVNINIEQEIFRGFPDLREFQRNVITNQFNDFNLTLSKEVEELSPSIIYNSSAIMNYVYLKRMDDIIGSDYISRLNYIVKKNRSESLYIHTLNNLENNIISDKNTIDYWADFLNIRQWYTWNDSEDLSFGNPDA